MKRQLSRWINTTPDKSDAGGTLLMRYKTLNHTGVLQRCAQLLPIREISGATIDVQALYLFNYFHSPFT
jgi:hypothetical protein